MKINKSKLMKLAWQLAEKFDTFAQALAHAWKVIKLRAKMMVGNVRFRYYKVDGSIRDAVGTLGVAYESKGTGRELPSDSFMYFDLEADSGKGGWRSAKVFNII